MNIKRIGVGAAAVVALAAACGTKPSTVSADCIKVVEESGQTTDTCLPVAPDSERVDLGTPAFSHPTTITNRLHPTSQVQQTIYGGHVDDKPFRTEVTLLPGTRPFAWRGARVDTVISQYVAYLDGRIHEVAIDWYAQADDGSVWYFGEDVYNYEDGKVADTDGTWAADDTTPAAMIMPATPRVGAVYRPENAPGVTFEEVRVVDVDQHIAGPSGPVDGAMEVQELHMDGSHERKIFAPGYGEFSTGSQSGELEAVSLAVPTDSRTGPAPAEFVALSAAVDGAYEAVAAERTEQAGRAVEALNAAWESARAKGIPPQLDSQMQADLEALDQATGDSNWEAAQSATLRIAQNALDLRLLHDRVVDVDLDRMRLWTRQLAIDGDAGDTGLVLADVAALDKVWERTRNAVDPAAPVDTALAAAREAADAEDLPALDRAAGAIRAAVGGLHTR